jgi:hypothetical protein
MPRDELGRFLPGPDPERHILSRAERQKGFLVATRLAKMPSRIRAWLRGKIRRHYQRR